MSYQLVEGDTGVVLRVTCTEGDPVGAVDLTDSTVLLRWKGDTSVEERDMLITSPSSGIVQYEFIEGDITAADMEFEVVITDPTGRVRSSLQTFRQRVREKLS